MKNKQHIFFDLDGTLTDPAEGITKGVRYALTHLGISAPPLEALRRFIGPPLKDAMQEAYGLSDAEGSEALRLYREYFSETGIFENELYPDIPRLLEVLKAGGKKLYLATSKPLVYAEEQVIERIRSIYQAQNRIPCTGCRYCVDGCYGKINIPEVFACMNDVLEGKEGAAERYKALERGADRCIGCDMCSHVCPQGLNIRMLMNQIAENFWEHTARHPREKARMQGE